MNTSMRTRAPRIGLDATTIRFVNRAYPRPGRRVAPAKCRGPYGVVAPALLVPLGEVRDTLRTSAAALDRSR